MPVPHPRHCPRTRRCSSNPTMRKVRHPTFHPVEVTPPSANAFVTTLNHSTYLPSMFHSLMCYSHPLSHPNTPVPRAPAPRLSPFAGLYGTHIPFNRHATEAGGGLTLITEGTPRAPRDVPLLSPTAPPLTPGDSICLCSRLPCTPALRFLHRVSLTHIHSITPIP